MRIEERFIHDVVIEHLLLTELQRQSLRAKTIPSIMCFAKSCYEPSVNDNADGSSYIGCEKQQRMQDGALLVCRCPEFNEQVYDIRALMRMLNIPKFQRFVLEGDDSRSKRVAIHAYVALLRQVLTHVAEKTSLAALFLVPKDKRLDTRVIDALCAKCFLMQEYVAGEQVKQSMVRAKGKLSLQQKRRPTMFPSDAEHEERNK